MSTSSILGASPVDQQADGKDVDLLGPSDSSDSGSDVQGERPMATAADNGGELGSVSLDPASDTDAGGTGERASADGRYTLDGADILPDRIIDDIGADDDPTSRAKSIEAAGLCDDDQADEDPEPENEESTAVALERPAHDA